MTVIRRAVVVVGDCDKAGSCRGVTDKDDCCHSGVTVIRRAVVVVG